MTTRRATDGSFHQSRYASSPEFQHGLAANLVALRTAKIESETDRQLIWFVQYLSLLAGGLPALAAALLKRFPHRLGTTTMVASGKSAGQSYSADEVREIRAEMPIRVEKLFPLRGELSEWDRQRFGLARTAATTRALCAESALISAEEPDRIDAECELQKANAEKEKIKAERRAALEKFPDSYPVEDFVVHCREAAEQGPKGEDCGFLTLEKELARLCLDPASDLSHGPWYFKALVSVLREYQTRWKAEKVQGVETTVFNAISQMIDYTMQAGGLTLLTGPSNVGARFAARELCRRSAGRMRFCEVPPSNDEASFYRAIGQALGGNWTNYKNVQIRERVESVLQSGEILLVLYSAQNLWPLANLREAYPRRLAWLMDQTQKGAAVCMISGPQFFMQKRACEKSGWDSPEFRNQLGHIAALPDSLSVEELTAVARVVLPEASESDCERIAISAVASERYLASVEAVTKRAKYLATRAGRIEQTAEDVDQAIQFVNQSDNLLAASLGQNRKTESGRRSSKNEPTLCATDPAPADVSLQLESQRSIKPAASQRGITPPEFAGIPKG